MASGEEKDAAAASDTVTNHLSYKDALVDGVPDPDPAAPASQQDKDKAEPAKDEKKDGTQNLKSHLVISGVVIAVIGAIFAIVKKMKDA